jgi:1,2-diacylglycerol 3-alpha-glucosyltransferase
LENDLNIGIVTTWFERGAAYVSRQMRDVLVKDNNVFIYARGGEVYAKGNPEWDGDYVHWARKFHREPTEIKFTEFDHWMNQNDIDVVIFNEQQWWPIILHCKNRGYKTAAYIDYYTEETLPLYGLYDILICNTKRHFEAFSWHPQAVYIPWGTDIDVFTPQTYDLVESGYLTFFHSAGMAPLRKGTEITIEAFYRAKIPNSKLIVHTQVDLLKALLSQKEIIAELQASGSLCIEYKTVSAPGLYHLGDIYVYPSHLEGIGLTMAEALSCGLPLVTVDYPPMNEFVFTGAGFTCKVDRLYSRKDGYYWPKNNASVPDLARVLIELSEYRVNISKLKTHAREVAILNLDWWKNSKEIYASLCKKGLPINHQVVLKAMHSFFEFDKQKKRSIKILIRNKLPLLYGLIKRIFKGRV